MGAARSDRARVRNLIAPLHYGAEGALVSDAFIQQVQQALHDLAKERNVTVKFIGFTDDAPLTGRDERIYGNALALSKARARRVAYLRRNTGIVSTPEASGPRSATSDHVFTANGDIVSGAGIPDGSTSILGAT